MKGSAITGPVAKECVCNLGSDLTSVCSLYLGGSLATYRVKRGYRRISVSYPYFRPLFPHVLYCIHMTMTATLPLVFSHLVCAAWGS